jgi:hypothetical protein
MLDNTVINTGILELNKTYQSYVAEVLMNVQPDFVFDLPAQDFTIKRFSFNG